MLHEAPLLVAVSGEAWTVAPRECEIADPGVEKPVLIDVGPLSLGASQSYCQSMSLPAQARQLTRTVSATDPCCQDG